MFYCIVQVDDEYLNIYYLIDVAQLIGWVQLHDPEYGNPEFSIAYFLLPAWEPSGNGKAGARI